MLWSWFGGIQRGQNLLSDVVHVFGEADIADDRVELAGVQNKIESSIFTDAPGGRDYFIYDPFIGRSGLVLELGSL